MHISLKTIKTTLDFLLYKRKGTIMCSACLAEGTFSSLISLAFFSSVSKSALPAYSNKYTPLTNMREAFNERMKGNDGKEVTSICAPSSVSKL